MLVRLVNASDRLFVHGLDGTRERRDRAARRWARIVELSGEADDNEMFLGFTSFTYPATPLRYDFATGTLTRFENVAGTRGPRRLRGGARSGTRRRTARSVPMFLVHKKGLPLDGQRPDAALRLRRLQRQHARRPSAPSRFVWLEQGGVYALANLRGGGEYGEAWHQAGMLDRKQNVFDDFIAAAEWLIESGYTRRERLAIQGGSNGGLLVGAAMTQRPDLFGAVVCQVPVADMLRYHLFTVGRYWIPEYGSADDPKQFTFLYAYSPLPQRQGRRRPTRPR